MWSFMTGSFHLAFKGFKVHPCCSRCADNTKTSFQLPSPLFQIVGNMLLACEKGVLPHPHSHSTYDFCSGISNGIPNLGATLQSEMRNGAPDSPLSGIPPCVIKCLVGVFNELLTTLDLLPHEPSPT